MPAFMPRRLVNSRLLGEAWLAALVVAVAALLAIASPDFLTLSNGVDLIESYSVTAILAIGVLVVLVTGGIDLSFCATASVAQYLAAYAATALGLPAVAVLLIGVGAGTLLGALNAVLIERLRATPVIVTIATMSAYFALLMYFTGGRSIYGLPGWWSDPVVLAEIGQGDAAVRVTLAIAVMAAVAIFSAVVMHGSSLGRQCYALGGNPEAARRLGMNLPLLNGFAYGYLGLLAGIAGLLQAYRVGEAVPNALVGGELNVIAAAVLGGASLLGGRGSVAGVMLGVLLLAILRNGLNLIGVSPYFFQVVIGAMLLVSGGITGLAARPQRRGRA